MRKHHVSLCLGFLLSFVSIPNLAAQTPGEIVTYAGNGDGAPYGGGYTGDGGPATSAELFGPIDVAVDKAGNVYIADVNNYCVRKVTPNGVITTAAGVCTKTGFSGDGGPAISALFNSVDHIGVDSAGNLYIADPADYRVRKVTAATGTIATIAGNGVQGYSGDGGPATEAELGTPNSVAVDASGNVYILDFRYGVIRKVVASTGDIVTVAGGGAANYPNDGALATQAALDLTNSIAVDSAGNFYFYDENSALVRKVTVSTGILSTVAGNDTWGYSGDGGPATSATINDAEGLATDSAGNLYIGDSWNFRIRKVTASTGIISTVAGDGVIGFSGDGGPATSAELDVPTGVAVDSAGDFYIADLQNNRIRKVFAGGLAASTTTLTVPAWPTLDGQLVELTAQVTGPIGAPEPTGTVTFYDGATKLGTAELNSTGAATFSTDVLSAGSHSLTASYGGSSYYNPSVSAAATFYVASSPAAAPSFSPAGGTYGERLQVALTDSSQGVSIYYTTDGSTPSATNGTPYSSAITVNATETIKAVAVGRQYALSAVSSASYVIHLPNEAPLPMGEWAWESGGNHLAGAQGPCGYGPTSVGLPGVYGTLGVPATGNTPGSRYGATRWTDTSGNLWLFAGQGFTSNANCALLNDLWKFNPSTLEWTWMSGSSTPSYYAVGVYGIRGKFAAANVPGSRENAMTWTDASGNLWLFGGFGYDSAGVEGDLNDMWEFNPSTREWAWMAGSVTANHAGVYGTRGVANAGTVPGGRWAGVSWTDRSGNLWLFGGDGFDSTGSDDGLFLNDLWKFNPSTREWTWMEGSSTGNANGVYGQQGLAGAANIPGARVSANSWTDRNGNFWLFGGEGYLTQGFSGILNDLWEFSPSTGRWTWMTGSDTQGTDFTPTGWGQTGIYGVLGVPDPGNTPGSRVYAGTWTDAKGDLWLFGGSGFDSVGGGYALNDLWEFSPSTDLWAWMGGKSANGGTGTYGQYRVPAAANLPGARELALAWTDNSGNLWLFGGEGRDSGGVDGLLNDLWEYKLPQGATDPTITTVSAIDARETQRISIAGSGLGSHSAYTGDSDFIRITDESRGNWQAGYGNDSVQLVVESWNDNGIILGGFTGPGWGTYRLRTGDSLKLEIWSAASTASGGSPAVCSNIVVGGGTTACKP